MYGCDSRENPQMCRVFPYMLDKLNPYFSFENSRFGVQKSKASTARVALFKELQTTPCIYTMESSFAGVDFGDNKGMHLTADMLETLGRDLCRSILIYTSIYVPHELRS
jgi:cytosolic carboxypeptidase protein 2/3